MSEQITPKELIDRSLEPLSAYLKSAGFSKSGRNYYRSNGETTAAFSVISSSWNGPNQAKFGIAVGVAVPSLAKKLGVSIPKKVTRTGQCSCSVDIGFLGPEKQQSGWEVKFALTPDAAGKEIVRCVEEYGLPWIEDVSTEEGFVKWLGTQQGLPAAETLWKLGKKVEARRCIEAVFSHPWHGTNRASIARFTQWLEEHPA
ncbi:MAG: DUF4304 domain-containing protein [Candidatus Thiodiazotropha sp. (ex Monitilora ramsayi)]|nr:DUF4304 domain-containing protein [Candidatus Thiodiazotropha sp. (ex Monitilora ramsayi)]